MTRVVFTHCHTCGVALTSNNRAFRNPNKKVKRHSRMPWCEGCWDASPHLWQLDWKNRVLDFIMDFGENYPWLVTPKAKVITNTAYLLTQLITMGMFLWQLCVKPSVLITLSATLYAFVCCKALKDFRKAYREWKMEHRLNRARSLR